MVKYYVTNRPQVQRNISADLLTVTESVRRNSIALKGVINVPHVGYSGALQNLNQNFRNSVGFDSGSV
jgi:hypothetical protein